MIFKETKLKGAFIIEPEKLEDSRGFFARSWCQKEMKAHGLSPQLAQCNISFNKKRATLRGMHYQVKPYEEIKIVRCTLGAIYDVIVDIRPESSTFKQWLAVELSADNRKMFYIPEGFAHGFQTLVDDTEVFYQMSEFFAPGSAQGIRWDDPAFNITWPIANPILSEKDSQYVSFVL